MESEGKIETSLPVENKDAETNCNQPLSLEIPEVNVNLPEKHQEFLINENPDKNKVFSTSFNHPFLDLNSGLSPFISNNIHNVSFNSLNLKGKNLFYGGNK